MSTPLTGLKVPPPAPVQPQSGKPTWLCQFSVLVDFPATMAIPDMEGALTFALYQYLVSVGLPGNVTVQLLATKGNTDVRSNGGALANIPVDISQPPPKGPGAPV